MPKPPKSSWRSSPLSGLQKSDDLRLPAEIRHHHRNILRRERHAACLGQVSGFSDGIATEPDDRLTALAFERPSQTQEKANAADHSDPLDLHVDELGDATDGQIDPKTLASPGPADSRDLIPQSPSFSPLLVPPSLHFDDDLQYDDKDHDKRSECGSEWSVAPCSVDLSSQRVQDNELPLAEEPFTLAQAARLFPSHTSQDELHKIYALLRKLLQVEPDLFTVVDPYDFIQVLACNGLHREQKEQNEIILRLRRQLTYHPSQHNECLAIRERRRKRHILLPFL